MKKTVIVLSVFGLIMSLCGFGFAAEQATTKTTTTAMSDAVRSQLVEKAKQTLSSQEWTIYMPITVGKKTISETDVFTFANGKISSKNLTAQGYKESNVNIGVQDDGTAVWETMQVDANNNLAFIRGELSGTSMKGVISKQPVKGNKATYKFSTSAS